jgi:hypothetical protein
MKRTSSSALFVAAVLALALVPRGAFADPPSKDQQKCITKLNKDGSKLAATQAKAITKCIRDCGKGKLDKCPDNTTCWTDDPKQKIAKKAQKTIDDANKSCVDDLPEFGLPGGSAAADIAAAVNAAAIDETLTLAEDVFGPRDALLTTLISCDADKDGCKCQQKVAKDFDKLAATKIKEFVKCKKFALKEGKEPFPLGAASAADLEACVSDAGTPGSIAADSKGKILKKADKIAKDAFKQCASAKSGPVDISLAFPGLCAGENAGGGETLATNDFARCVDERVECRVCLLINQMDGLNVDCDTFDDGVDNDSCPPQTGLGSHKCTLDTGSEINLFNALLNQTLAADGAIDISCGTPGDLTGIASCDCGVQDPGLSPLNIGPGLFWACIKPSATVCPAGALDCDGGSLLGIDLSANTDINNTNPGNTSPCTPASCDTDCAAFCGGVANVFQASCEGFCSQPPNSACTNDAQCDGFGEGACNGRDGQPLGNSCDCTCLDNSVGPPSDPGDLQCQLAFNLTVEQFAGTPCDGVGVTIDVGDTCAPLSSASANGLFNNNDDNGGSLGPFSGTGLPTDCSTFETSVTTGMELSGTTAFYGSTVGDILTGLTLVCE